MNPIVLKSIIVAIVFIVLILTLLTNANENNNF